MNQVTDQMQSLAKQQELVVNTIVAEYKAQIEYYSMRAVNQSLALAQKDAQLKELNDAFSKLRETALAAEAAKKAPSESKPASVTQLIRSTPQALSTETLATPPANA